MLVQQNFNSNQRIMYTCDKSNHGECHYSILFAQDTSIFTVVNDPNTAAVDMNHDFILINLWVCEWRMSFNPDPTKQAVEMTFSKKTNPIKSSTHIFDEVPVKKCSGAKTVCMRNQVCMCCNYVVLN